MTDFFMKRHIRSRKIGARAKKSVKNTPLFEKNTTFEAEYGSKAHKTG